MENKQLALDAVLQRIEGQSPAPRLLLQACCAPCSSYVLEYLSRYFEITIDYYNPNIYPEAEYRRRAKECEDFVPRQPHTNAVIFREAEYNPAEFYRVAAAMADVPEGGARCFACYALRLAHTAKLAAAEHFDWFCTTLSISPHKNAAKLNEIGTALGEKYGVPFLPSDFKKRGGYLRSTQLSAEYGLYRQTYCGCEYSLRAAEKQQAERAAQKAAVGD